MIKIESQNFSSSIKTDISSSSRKKLSFGISNEKALEKAEKGKNKENLIVVGRGGSVSTFRGIWEGYGKYDSDKNVYIVDTSDPYYLDYIKRKTSSKNTQVLVISKSGETIDVIENSLFFSDCPQIFITQKGNNSLRKIAEEKKYEVIDHPPVGGRFSGLTEVALIPAFICGLDIDRIVKGAERGFSEYEKPKNGLQEIAGRIAYAENQGYEEIYFLIYSKLYASFSELITQLIHESASKKGKGITVLVQEAPESHHHTNQRLFGGPKNIFPFFITVTKGRGEIEAEEIGDLQLSKVKTGDLAQNTLRETMNYEFRGVYEDAQKHGFPIISAEIWDETPDQIGHFIAFFQFFSVYLAEAMGVNPFDQPEVEEAKKISLALRKRK